MNPEVKTKWLEALRSNDYKQGKCCLRSRHNNFCCLGVLCDLYAKEHPDTQWEVSEYYFTLSGDYEFLPDKVKLWACLTDKNPKIEVNNKVRSLSELNDAGGYDFDKIANIIEAQL